MSGRSRRSVSLSAGANKILAEVENPSEYVGNVLEAAQAAWIGALSLLSKMGWSSAEIVAAADRIPRRAVSIDPAQISALIALGGPPSWSNPERWNQIVLEATWGDVARALRTVSFELIFKNPDFTAALTGTRPP